MSAVSTVYLLVGTKSGKRGNKATAAAEVAQKAIAATGQNIENISKRDVKDSLQAARNAVAAGAKRLLVVGGDGTLNIALQAVAESDTVLGIVPAGTGNDFASTFGLHRLTTEQAVKRALGASHLFDAIKIDSIKSRRNETSWVASSITGGFSVDVNTRAERLRPMLGKSRFVVATLLAVPQLRHTPLVFIVDNHRHEIVTTFWALTNTRTFGRGMAISPTADPCDGILELVVIADASRRLLLRMLPTVFNGSHIHHPKVHTFTGKQVTIENLGKNSFHKDRSGKGLARHEHAQYELGGDGELIGCLPVTASVAPNAVRLAADPP